MLATANVEQATFLHDYTIPFDFRVSLPPFLLFFVLFLYRYLFYQ
jgi:hypothetical protein